MSHSCSSHGSGNRTNYKLELILYFIGLALFVFTWIFIDAGTTLEWVFYITSLILAGYELMFAGLKETITNSIKHRRFKPNVHLLMVLAAIGAILIKEYREATLLILIFAGAHLLEEYAEGKSKKEITSLIKLNPKTARLINPDGTNTLVDVTNLSIGNKLLVLNGDQVPTDGIIYEGSSAIDESSITGESIPSEKSTGDLVYGGSINGNYTFKMEVTKDSKDTVIAKIVELVSENQTNISETAKLIKRIEPIYVTIVLLFAPIFYLLGIYLFKWTVDDSFYRTMVYLIGASPCALAATDIPATLSAISNLAKRNVLFKGGSYLSNLADVEVVAFDKTGTLTNGKPLVTDIHYDESLNDDNKDLYLNLLISMEKSSNHPLAKAIIDHFENDSEISLEVENMVGVGLRGSYENIDYYVGKPSSFKNISTNISTKTSELEEDGKTVIYFGTSDAIYIVVALQDIPKESAIKTVKYLNNLDIKTVMLTGDAVKTGNAIGRQIGINEVIANVLPAEKSEVIKVLKETYGITAMLGDGVNDAPALVASDIGVAMGGGTDIAIESADAVLIKNDLTNFIYIHKIALKLRKIVIQNIIFAMAIVLFLLVINIASHINIGFAVVAHEGSTLIVILNGLRMLKKLK